jgi:cytochrome b involved in lipid metabolism
MKKLVGVSLFIFWAILTALLTAGLILYQNKADVCPTLATTKNLTPSSTGEITLNVAELAKHNSPNDCWLLINNKIFNVSSYLTAHPGGVSTIAPYCGKEATKAFDTKGGSQSHSSYANSLLTNYYIGGLNQLINTQDVQNNIQKTNSVQPPAQRGEREDD